MLKRSVYILIIALTFSFAKAVAQTGTVFWFAAPEVTSGHNDVGPTFRFTNTSSTQSANVTVTQPANPAFVITPNPITIAPNSSYSLVLDAAPNSYKALIENTPTNTVLNKGILITSDVPITAYYEVNNNNNNEIFALKGANGLGTEFYVPITQNSLTAGTLYNHTGLTPQAYTTFDIVATEDGTSVQIFSRVPVDGYPANTPFTINLNRGQTYSCGWTGANYHLPANQPSGAAVLSNKPIAITIKEDSKQYTGNGCYDLIGDQIVPVDIIGTDYIVIKGQLNATAGESFFILATQNNTKVYINGSATPVATLFAGQTYFQDNITLARYFIHTDKPVYCTQVTGFGCELGSALLPPLNCAGSRSVSFVRSTAEAFYLNIMVKAGSEGNFILTGGSNPNIIQASDFAVVPGTNGEWLSSYAKSFTLAEVPQGTAMILTNTSDVFGLGLINGAAATGCRFGFFSEFAARIVVEAGPNQNVCANDTIQLAGSVTGGAIQGIWSCNGSGTFIPDNTTLNAQYVPSGTDKTNGTVTFTLTSVSSCFPVTDMVTVTIPPAPVVNAGTDMAAGANNANVTLNGSVTVATGGIWTGGGGTYNPSATTLNATYTPSAGEILAGSATLTLTSTGNGICNPEQDQITITYAPAPVVNAGLDKTVCANNPNVNIIGTISNATGGIWTGGGGIFNPNNTALNIIYTPTVAEITAGVVTLTLTSTGNGPCSPVSDQVTITINSAPVVNAGSDINVCGNNSNSTLNGSITIASGGVWSGGLGTYSPNNTTLNAIYTPSSGEILLGTATLTLTSTGNGLCNAVSDNITISISPQPVSNAGTDQTKCSNNAAITLAGNVSNAGGGIWSGGSGTFNPGNSDLNATYSPTQAEINSGSVSLTLTTSLNGLCNSVTDNMTVTFTPAPVTGAGPDQSKCSNNADALLLGSVTVASGGVWSGGNGTYNPGNTALNSIYTPTAAEISSGMVTLTLTSTGNGTCNAVSDNVVLSFTSSPVANANIDQSKCYNNPNASLNGAVTLATGGQWSGGLGIFSPSNSSLTATYTPTAGELSTGTVSLTLTTTGNGNCNAVSDNMVISFTPAPTVNAGTDQTVCKNKPNVTLAGVVNGATGGIWSGGTGTYNPNNTTLNAIYTPSASEIASGTVNLTLTTTGNGNCNAVSDQLTITLTTSPTVNAGIDATVCANNSSLTLNGAYTIATGAIWSGGTGIFNPNNTTTNAIYTPSAAEISSGNVILTITTTGNGLCNSVSDNVNISISSAPTINAGIDQTKCANNPASLLNATFTVASGIQWSGGLGTFSPNSATANATYTPTSGEISSGSLSLTITSTGNGTCNAVSDNMIINFTSSPTVNAGLDQSACGNNAIITLNGSNTISTGIIWSGGAGTYNPNNTTLNAIYTPSASEIAAGSANLILTTTGNGLCNAVSDDVLITLTNAPTANAGVDATVCSNNPSLALNGTISVATGGQWSGGSGTYNPGSTSLNTIYTPSAAEILLGSATLTLTTTGNGNCNSVSDNVLITITSAPTVSAGTDQTKCVNNSTSTLNGTFTIATGVQWSGGLGTFTPNSTTLNASYTPTAGEVASGNLALTLTTTGNGTCNAVSDNMIITFTSAPTINAGVDQSACKNKPDIILNGTQSGATGAAWSGGAGVFSPNSTTLNATYTPSASEITAGSATLTLTTTGNGLCNAVSDIMLITLTNAPTANAGTDATVCANNPSLNLNGLITVATGGQWSGGTGNYNPGSGTINTIYTPSASEISTGSVTLTLTTTGNGNCNSVSDNIVISITPQPTVNAGIDQTKCVNNAAISLAGTYTIATGAQWSGGLGTFTPNSTDLNAVYTPSNGELSAGLVTLTLTTTGNASCNAVSDNITISFTSAPTVNAGTDQTVCSNNSNVSLNGTIIGASGGIWSGGTGTFSPNSTALDAIYFPSADEKNAGIASLVLSSTGNGTCNAVSDNVIITITPAPIVNAGADKTICANNPEAALSGNITGATGGQWLGGTGNFNPGNSSLNTIYTLSPSEIALGSVTLTLNSTGNGLCNAVSDNLLITVTPSPTVSAGPDQITGANNSSISLNGSVSIATGGLWSGGLGVFTPGNSTLNATYSPTTTELNNGSLTLTLTTTGNGLCNAVSDNMTISFTPPPVVNAGIDQSLCANNPNVILNGAVSGATGGIWTGGAGTFNPNNTTLSATYIPSASEISSGIITLTLTSTGNGYSNPVSDDISITFSPAPTINAGLDKTICSNNSNVILSGSVAVSAGGVWSGGSGVFNPSNTALNTIYTPSATELAIGNVTLTLTSTGNGNCNAVSDNMIITINPSPTTSAGTDQTKCANNSSAVLNGSVSIATGGQWSGGLGTFTPSNTALNATYTPTATEISNGNVTLTLTSTGNGLCNAVTDNVEISFTPAPLINAGGDQAVCANNSNVTLSGTVSVATGGIWSGGTGTFNPNNTSLNAVYTPSPTEISAGTVVLTITSTGNGQCNSVNDNISITIGPAPIISAGADKISCVNNPSVVLNGSVFGATGGIWTGGDGSFVPSSTSVNPTYTPSATEIANGTANLTFTTTGIGSCNAVSDNMIITIMPSPVVNAGTDQTICSNNTVITLSGSVNGAPGGIWSGGLGLFNPGNTSLNPTYTPTAGEIAAGTLSLTLTSASFGSCNSVSDNMVITFTSAPIVNAGTDQQVCGNNATLSLNGNVIIATGGQWSGGSGSFSNSNQLNTTYNPSAAEILAGTATLTLSSTGNGNCNTVTDNLIITIKPAPIVNAGTDLSACINNSIVTLNGSVTNVTGGVWTGGTGTFSPGNTNLNAQYTPSASEIAAGSATLTLTSIGNGNCIAVSDQVNIAFNPKPVVNANSDQIKCSNNPGAQLNGSISIATGGIWTGGLGIFTPNNTTLNAIYTPTTSEISTGLTLTLTSTGNGNCNAEADYMAITFTTSPTANAGPDKNVCSNNPNVNLSGIVSISTGGIWTGGSGTFTPDNTSLNTTYTPTAAEIASGSVTLTLTTTGNGNCNPASDNMVITFSPAPAINAGTDRVACVNNASVSLFATVTGSTGGTWSGGAGVFNPSVSALNATYTPTASEIAAGFVNLTLTSTGNGTCNAVADQMTISFNPSPTANAGIDRTVCANNPTVNLSASVTLASGGQWTGGSGTYSPNSSSLTAVYTPSAAEISSGIANLIFTSTGNGTCNAVSDNLTINITPSPFVNAGIDQVKCANNSSVSLAGVVTISAGGQWSGGAGNFIPTNTALDATYNPTVGEIASGIITLTLTSVGNGNCASVSDNISITINPAPIVNAGFDKTACANNSLVTLNGAVANAIGGVWSGGSGVFNPSANTLNSTYTPTLAEIAAGNVTLTLTSTGNGTCTPVSDVMTITYNPSASVNAGSDATICVNNPVINLSASVTSATGGQWSGGLGLFSPSSTSLNATYTPTMGEILAGSVNLILTSTGNGNCNAVSDNAVFTFTSSPTVDAGSDITVCANNSIVPLIGNITIATGGIWSTSGSGVFLPSNTSLNATYTPSASDISAGNVTLNLTTTGNGNCIPISDNKQIIITPAPIVNAGNDQTICPDNLHISLSGSVSGGTSTGIWTSSGTGSFNPGNFALNATYFASSLDSTNTGVNLFLTSTGNGNCIPVKDSIRINIFPAGIANAGTDQTVCGNNSIASLNGVVSGGAVTGYWTTSGSGTFTPGISTLNASYTPSQNDIAAGFVSLALHANSCNFAQDIITINITPAPTVNAGTDIDVCINNPQSALNGIVAIATGGIWTGGSGTFNPNNTTIIANYNPSAAEIASGQVNLILTSTGNGNCIPVSDTVKIKINPPPIVNAGEDRVVCANNANIILTGTVSGSTNTGLWSSSGSGAFSPSASNLNATYIPSQADKVAGTVTLTITSTNNGGCIPVSDEMTISFTSAPTVDAGADLSKCANNYITNLTGNIAIATGGQWSGGLGNFAPDNNSTNATYTPTAAEISAGSVTLTLTSTGNGNCLPVADNIVISISPTPIVNAGNDIINCVDNLNVPLFGNISGITNTGIWSTSGTGTFAPNNTSLNAIYRASSADSLSGLIILTLTSTNNGSCNSVNDALTLRITPAGIANAGPDATVCANNASVMLNGTISGGASKGRWTSSGTGTFIPSDTMLNATYLSSPLDTTIGNITISLTATNSCNLAFDNLTVNFTHAPNVNAGTNQTICANNIITSITGTVSNASGGQWSGGLGTFNPGSNYLTAAYTPTNSEIDSGLVKLYLTSTGNGNCNSVKDSIYINITPAPTVNAGIDLSSCANNSIAMLNGIVTNAPGGLWTGGTGTYTQGSTSLTTSYIPSASEISNGNVTLILTSTGNGNCLPVSDNIILTIKPSPIVDAGNNIFVCANNANASLNGVITNETGGTWSGGSGYFSPNNSALNSIYHPTSVEIFLGSVTLTLTSSGNGECQPVSDNVLISFTTPPTSNAGSDQTVCANNSTASISGNVSMASGGQWTGGQGTYNPDNNSLNVVYTPTIDEINDGFVTLTLTTTGNGNCLAVKDSMKINITPAPIVNAGNDLTSCVNNPTVTLSGNITNAAGGIWFGGSGSFNPGNAALNAIYTPSPSEIATGSTVLSLLSTGNGNCNFVSDNVSISFNHEPVVNAGIDQTLCANNASIHLNGSVSYAASGVWSGGSGAFSPSNTALNAIYTPTAAEITAGTLTLVLTSTGNGNCNAISDNVTFTFTPAPIANAGTNISVCANKSEVNLQASITVASGGVWTGGAGVFEPSNTSLIATYNPTAAEIAAGVVSLTLTTTGNGTCIPVSDNKIITITPAPVVNAGTDQTLCVNNSITNLNGIISNANGGIWTGGNGVFNPSGNTLSPSYTPTSAELASGAILLTLTSTGNGNCIPVSDNIQITFNPSPIVDAGSDKAICSNNPAVNLNANISLASGGLWTGGLGLFSPSQNSVNATYTPTAGEILSGGLTLTLTSTGNGNCNAVSDNMQITFTPTPTVEAGSNATLCANNSTINLNGNVNVATGGTWTSSGTGIFTPDNTSLTSSYIPSSDDIIAGNVTLTLTTTGNGNCLSVSDNKIIIITPAPFVSAGNDHTVCPDNLAIPLSGSISGGTTTGIWTTSGTGTFNPGNFALNATYIASSLDSANQGVNIILSSSNNGNCLPVRDTARINIFPAGISYAGNDEVVCANNASVVLNGQISGGALSGVWSSTGTGIFSPNASTLNAAYIPSSNDVANGSITLTLKANSCNLAQDQMSIIITPAPFANAGPDQDVCINNNQAQLSGVVQNATGGVWTGGSGTFNPNSSSLIAMYTPSSTEILAGQANILLTTTGIGNCNAVTDTITININPQPIVNAGPDKTVCANNASITLNGQVSGGTTTGIWSTSGTGTFAPSSSTLNATYIPSNFDKITGTITLTLTSSNNGGCLPESDDLQINFTPAPTADAGMDVTVCGNNSLAILNGNISIANGGIWSTNGTGVFVPGNSNLNAAYLPSSADTAIGSVIVTLTTSGNGTCNPVNDSKIITIIAPPYVSAGPDKINCVDNLSVNLLGNVSGISSTGIWSSTGSGYFLPNQNELNATYYLSSADSISGNINLILTSSNNLSCLPVKDTMIISIVPGGIVNAGTDKTVCANNAAITLNGTISGGASKGKWTSSGSGVFIPSDTSLSATYISSNADTSAGIVTITLTATNSCNSASDNIIINYTNAPLAYAGQDQTLCGNNANVNLTGSVSVAGGGMWTSSGTGTFVPSNTSLEAIYMPGINDLTNGSVIISLNTTSNGLCNAVHDFLNITFTPKPNVNAGSDQAVCASSTMTQMLGFVSGGATTGQWTSTGSGNFIPNSSMMNAYYEYSAADLAAGSVQLILTSTNNGNCNAENDAITITFGDRPFVYAGSNKTVCANNLNFELNSFISGGSSTGVWTTSGSGIFFPNNTNPNPVYYMSQADSIAGNINIYLTSTNNGSCLPGKDTVSVTVEPIPFVNAGSNKLICDGTSSVSLFGTSFNSPGILWTTDGAGSFNPGTNFLSTNYFTTNTDSAIGIVKIFLTSTGNIGCLPAKDTLVITYQRNPVVDAGEDQTICAGTIAILNGQISGSTTSGFWNSSGSGTFLPDENTLTAQYIPSAADSIFGNVFLLLTSTNNGACNAINDTLKINITPPPFIEAGQDFFTCNARDTIQLYPTGAYHSSVQWNTSGTGTFIPNANTLNASYLPSIADSASGNITLIITASGSAACSSSIDALQISFGQAGIANAGADQNICASADTISLNGSIIGGTTTGMWTSSGSGTFAPGSSALNTSYILSAADSVSSQIRFILASTSNGNCLPAKDTMIVFIEPIHKVNAGADMNFCSNLDTIFPTATSNFPTEIMWSSSGTGMFIPNSSTINAGYLPSTADSASGTVKLILSSTNIFACNVAIDTMTISFGHSPIVIAGNDQQVCASADTITLNGAIAGGTYTGVWTSSGSGTFSPGNESLNSSYILSPADSVSSQIRFILTSANNGNCQAMTDTMIVFIDPIYKVNAGPDINFCGNTDTIFPVASSNFPNNIIWSSSGTGTFAPNNSTINAGYMPSSADSTTGTVKLILASTNVSACSAAVDTMIVSIGQGAIVSAGTDRIICANKDTVSIQGTISGGTITGTWTSSGTGYFTPNENTLNAVYNFSSSDSITGLINIVLASTNNGMCQQVKDTIRVEIVPIPVVNAGSDIEICTVNSQLQLSGTSMNTPGIKWTSTGTGYFTPDAFSLNAVYNLSTADSASTGFNIMLQSTGDQVCSASSDTLRVNIIAPLIPNFTNTSSCLNQTINFSDNSIIVTGTIISWEWNFGGGNVANSQTTSFSYDTLGNFPVTLNVESSLGCTYSLTKTIAINPIPFADFNYSTECSKDSVHFNDNTNISSGTITSFTWNFGDDSTATGSSTTHLYSNYGIYNVKLTAISNFGCEDQVTKQVTVYAPPTADFSYLFNCNNSLVTFTDQSLSPGNNVNTWKWNMGDGNSYNTQNPSHTYQNNGIYNVQLIASSSQQCADTVSAFVSVNNVIGGFRFENACVNSVISFTDTSKYYGGFINYWKWDFGDGRTSTSQNPSNMFTVPGTYEVKLIVGSSTQSCSDTISNSVIVYPQPVANFDIAGSTHLISEPVICEDLSINATSWLWNFGDFTPPLTTQAAQHNYTSAGNYNIVLIVHSKYFCSDTLLKSIALTDQQIYPPKMPTGFTPNGDGLNDILLVRGGPFKTIEFKVYNKWGEMIFETSNAEEGWDGKRNGEIQPVGEYVYTIKAITIDGGEYKKSGNITLIR